jgi:DNA polymerase elongation subunit (family B)
MVDVWSSYMTGERMFEKPKVVVLQGMDEKKILVDFLQLIRDFGNRIITFNGVNFDCPFIIRRCQYNKIKVDIELSTRRFSVDPHFDLLQYLSNYKTPTQGLKMSEYCSLFGIKTSKDEFSGADVYPAYLAGEWDRLAQYTIDDCNATYDLFMAVRPYCGYLFQFDDHNPATNNY